MGIKVALLINEYFGAIGTGFGGYGFLARRLFAKYINSSDIQVDVLLHQNFLILFQATLIIWRRNITQP